MRLKLEWRSSAIAWEGHDPCTIVTHSLLCGEINLAEFRLHYRNNKCCSRSYSIQSPFKWEPVRKEIHVPDGTRLSEAKRIVEESIREVLDMMEIEGGINDRQGNQAKVPTDCDGMELAAQR